jgi:glycosyltransferase involved in cell wall biosynthesis
MSENGICSIICVKNAVGTLTRTLDSVFAQAIPQGFGPMEVIVIDGSSSDGSAELAAGRAGVRLVRQANTGLAAARNEAVLAATAPFIAFCDADDCWTEGSLALRLRAFAANPQVGAVIGHIILEPVTGELASAAQQALIGVARPGFTPGGMVVRREVFEHVGRFDETLRIGSDSDWFVRLRQSQTQLRILDDVVLRKGARRSSLSGDVAAYRRELLTVARRFIDRQRSDESV